MTGRILRTELRRSSAPWVVALVALLGAAMMYVVVRGWGGRWMSAALWQREYLFALIPFALGAGAWQASREPNSKVGELFTSTPRPRWQRVIPTAGAMAIAAALGYLAMFAAVAVQAGLTATYFTLAIVPVIAVGALAMVAAVWLGLAVGTLLPSRLAAPALVVVGLGGLMWSIAREGKVSLVTGAVSRPQDDFSAVAAGVHVGQGLWLVALAAGAMVLYAASSWLGRLAAVAPAALGLVAALAILPAEAAEVSVPDPRAARLVCTTDAPKVCLTAVHQAALPDVRGPAREALRILAGALPDTPTAATESTVSWSSSAPDRSGALLIPLVLDSSGRLGTSPKELVAELLEGAGTRPCGNIFTLPGEDAVSRHHAARAVVSAWLLGAAKPPPGDELVERGLAALRSMPASEQRARVLAVRTSAAACDGRDLLDLIAPGIGAK